jgi:hypothetical protein
VLALAVAGCGGATPGDPAKDNYVGGVTRDVLRVSPGATDIRVGHTGHGDIGGVTWTNNGVGCRAEFDYVSQLVITAPYCPAGGQTLGG